MIRGTKVKICGITRLEDAMNAVGSGADALGFVFANSPRRVTISQAKLITQHLPPMVSRVGVFVNEKESRILKIAKGCGLDTVQLHGDETPAFCQRLGRSVNIIKVFPVREDFRVSELLRFKAKGYMLETPSLKRGGAGKCWDWNRLKAVRIPVPFIVTGGLTPQNVRRVIQLLRPYGVDVSTGVEKKPGIKDAKKMRRFDWR